MGFCCSCPCSQNETRDQFESLVIPKPSPVDIVDIQPESSNSDIPLFAPAPSDDDNVEVSDVEGYSRQQQLNQARAIYKYNVSKKISQLNKVIQLFLAQVSENELHKLIIKERYEKTINQIFQNYENIATVLQKEVNELQSSVNTNIAQEYISKVTEIENDYNEEVNSLNSLTQTLKNETEKLIQTFTDIKSNKLPEIDHLMANFSQNSSDQFNDLQSHIKELKSNFLVELNTVDDESKIKIEKIQKQSEETLKKINDQYLNELEKIQKESFVKIGVDPNLHIQFQSQKTQFTQLKDDFQKYFNCFHKNLFECRSKFKELMNFYSSDLDLYEKASIKLESRNNQEFQIMFNEENGLKNEIDQKSIQFNTELNEKQSELSNLIQALSDEFAEQTNIFKNDFYSKNSSLSELILKLTKEKDEIISQHEIEKKLKIEIKLKNLMNLQQQEDNQFISTKKRLGETLQKLKEDHFSEKASKLSMHQEMTESEIRRFSEEMMKLRQSIQTVSNNGNQILFQHKQTLSNLQKEKDEIDLNFKEKMMKFNEEKNQEIEKISKQNFAEIEQLGNNQTELLNSCLNKNNGLIKENEEDFKKKKELIIEKYEKERLDLLAKIQAEYLESTENEMNILKQKFESLYEQQSFLLSQIQPPSSSNLFSQLTNEANDLAIKRAELCRTISIRRGQLDLDFEDQINIENLRHEEFLNELKNTGRKSNGRDTFRQSLRMQINNVKNSKNEESEKYRRLLIELENDHNQKLNQLLIDLNKEKDLYEATEKELKEKFSLECENCKNEIDFVQNNFQNDKFSFQNEIVLLQKEYETKINDLIGNKNELIRKFQLELNDLMNKLNQVKIDGITENENEKNKFSINCSSLKNRHEINVSEMNDLLSENSASIARFSISNRIELERNQKENDENISNLISLNEKEIEELIQNNASLTDFYNEKIEVLIQRSNEAKEKFINRPPREIEVEKIKKYEKYCSKLTKILKSGLNDILNYRRINAIKEKEYNRMFGSNPSVGVLIVGSSNNNYQYY